MTEIKTTRIDAELDCEVEVSTQDAEEDSGVVTLRIVDQGNMMEALLQRKEVLELIAALQQHVERV